MGVFILPCEPNLYQYDFTCDLEGITYGFAFRWNPRDEAWFMNILDGEGVVIQAGLKVVVNWPLGIRSASDRLPIGRFLAVDTTGANQDPGLNDLGVRTKLVYLDSNE